MSFKYNNTPLKSSKGLIVGPDYTSYVLNRLEIEPQVEVKKCVRATLITRKCFLDLEDEKVATFVYPPFSFGEK